MHFKYAPATPVLAFFQKLCKQVREVRWPLTPSARNVPTMRACVCVYVFLVNMG